MENNKLRPIITIDGPAASGKGTIAKRLAKDFNLFYLETGVFYRALAKLFLVKPVKNNLKKFLTNITKEMFFGCISDKKLLYTEEVAEKASTLAKLIEVREFVTIKQLEMLLQYPKNF